MLDKAGKNGKVAGTKWRLQPRSPWDGERGREETRCKRVWEREETLLARSSGGEVTCTHISQSRAGRRKTVMARQGVDKIRRSTGSWRSFGAPIWVVLGRFRERASTNNECVAVITKRPTRTGFVPNTIPPFYCYREATWIREMSWFALHLRYSLDMRVVSAKGQVAVFPASHMTSLFNSSP